MSTPTTNQPIEHDLIINLHPCCSRVDYMGAAAQDKAFQDFKALFVPERKNPGRKPKATQGVQ